MQKYLNKMEGVCFIFIEIIFLMLIIALLSGPEI